MADTNGGSRLFRFFNVLFFVASLILDALLLLYGVELISRRNGDGILIWSMNQPLQFFANIVILFFLLLGMAFLLQPRRGIRIVHWFLLLVSTVSYYKSDYRGEPLLLTDFMQAKEGLAIAGKLHFDFSWFLIFTLIVLGLIVPLLFPKKTFIFQIKLRLLLSAVAFLCFAVCLKQALGIPLTPTYQYKYLFEENGFFLGLAETRPRQELERPEDYSRNRVIDILGVYAGQNSVEPKIKPDIFFIMSESLFDLASETDLVLTSDPLEKLRVLMEEGIGARTITPGYGGGTFYAEYEVLTGYRAKDTPTRIYYDSQVIQPGMKSVVRVFSEQGYRTTAVHPNTGTFYNRERSYTAMGFDRMYFKKELGEFKTYIGSFPSDRELFEKVLAIYDDDTKEDTPCFYHIVTYQNHGSYNYRYDRRDIRIEGLSDEETRNQAENYANAVLTHVEAVCEFVEILRERERPALIVLWGDHAPAVRFMGVSLPEAPSAQAEFYTTPLLIWNNYEEKYEWPDTYMSTYRLGASVLNLLDMDSDNYFQWLAKAEKPDMVTALGLLEEKESFFRDEERYQRIDADMKALHYDRLIGEHYGEEAAP